MAVGNHALLPPVFDNRQDRGFDRGSEERIEMEQLIAMLADGVEESADCLWKDRYLAESRIRRRHLRRVSRWK